MVLPRGDTERERERGKGRKSTGKQLQKPAKLLSLHPEQPFPPGQPIALQKQSPKDLGLQGPPSAASSF